MRFTNLCHTIGEEYVPLSSLYIKLFELGVKVALYNGSAVVYYKVELFEYARRGKCSERTDDAFVLFVCFCFFHFKEPPVSVRWLVKFWVYIQSTEPHWLRPHPVACPRNNLLDWNCHGFLYFLWLVPHFAFSARFFFAADFLILFSSPQRAHVTFFVKRDKFELAFWLISQQKAGRISVSCTTRVYNPGKHNCFAVGLLPLLVLPFQINCQCWALSIFPVVKYSTFG